MRSIGISTEDDQVFTTSMATANYIAEQKKGASVYVVGEEGIIEALKEKE
ncbi:hypothetical protein KEH51_12180 [[Brevibacterium] frigoritolerans]|uniref:Uncharacterized protein n=1 Tax=Peribacillus frigoritolerans TaxID=450367 RepID=A0A941FNP0_9BACI|nr:hypothetical protein [Peribacillus frigoritolerans]